MVDYNRLRKLTMANCMLGVLCPSLRMTAEFWIVSGNVMTSVQHNVNSS